MSFRPLRRSVRLPFRLTLLALALAGALAHAAPPLSLAEAQHLATAEAPQLAAQAASVTAAEQMRIGASEQADPKLILSVENVPTDGPDRYNLTRDGMTMRKIGFMQEFTRGDKLRLRGDRADAEVRRESAVLAVTRLNVRRDVALAWIERYFAERQLEQLRELARESEIQVATSQAALAGGKGQAADPLAARLAVAQLADRIIDAERNVARAVAGLESWIGTAARQPLDTPPAFDQLAHRHEELTSNLENHPHLAMFAPMQAAANSEWRLAQTAKQSDWSLEVAFGQRGPAYTNMLSVAVKIDLPIFQSTRQDPAQASKAAMVEQIRAQAEDAKRAHAAEIGVMFADWNAAKARMQRYTAELLPLARERTEVSLAAYRGGKGELMPVLEARKAEIETRMNYLMAQNEMARAWAQLNAMLPDRKDPS